MPAPVIVTTFSKAQLYPDIDFDEPSARAGVDGPRYVPMKDLPGVYGDTNTGRSVHPIQLRP